MGMSGGEGRAAYVDPTIETREKSNSKYAVVLDDETGEYTVIVLHAGLKYWKVFLAGIREVAKAEAVAEAMQKSQLT